MRKKAPRRIARETPAEKYYKRWIHRMWCVGLDTIPDHRFCVGPIQQCHLRDMTGASRKEDNFSSVSGCRAFHESYDQALGYFAGWTKPERKAWFRCAIMKMHAKFVSEHGCRPEDYVRGAATRAAVGATK